MEIKFRMVHTELKVGAASICKAGTAKAEPINVCGRVNRHKTMGNGTGFAFGIESSTDGVSVTARPSFEPFTTSWGNTTETMFGLPFSLSLFPIAVDKRQTTALLLRSLQWLDRDLW